MFNTTDAVHMVSTQMTRHTNPR